MEIKHIPYTYFNQTLYYDVLVSDELYNALLEKGSGFSYIWNNITDTNPILTLNNKIYDLIGFNNLLPIEFHLYVGLAYTSPTPDANFYAKMKSVFDLFNMTFEFVNMPSNLSQHNIYDITGTCSNNSTIETRIGGFNIPSPLPTFLSGIGAYNSLYNVMSVTSASGSNCYIYIPVIPSSAFKISGIDMTGVTKTGININFKFHTTNDRADYITYMSLGRASSNSISDDLAHWNGRNLNITTSDLDNPYGKTSTSTTGGGDGAYGNIDEVDPAEIPSLPSLSAADLGFVTIYNPTAAQLKQLSSFMWSNVFDLDTYKKLFSDPMESIIGLAIVPVAPSIAGQKHVMFGTIDSGVSMDYLSTQYVQQSCGSVDIDKYVGSFLDSAPYTKISIYLPFIGIHELSPDDLMSGSIEVVYNIDVLSGACCAMIKHSTRGVLYSYNGSCISNIPLTSINFSSAIQNAVSAVCSGAAIVAGMASGAAPITAMGAMGLASSAANTALNSKPTVKRSGSLGGSAGIMGILKPYVIIERPDISVPSRGEHYEGQTCNITSYLGDLSGFTMVEAIHLHGIAATSQELAEIEALLKQGVIL